MKIVMKRERFEHEADLRLGWVCAEPLVRTYQAAVKEISPDEQQKEATVKAAFFQQLNEGQQALFLFYAFYNHAIKSLPEYFWWSAYWYAQPKVWTTIKAGATFFEDQAMLQQFERMEEIFTERNFPRTIDPFTVSQRDLEHDPELLAAVQRLHAEFLEASPSSVERIGRYIRNYPGLFVLFEA